MSRSDETLFRQWVMLSRIPRYPMKISVSELNNILFGEGYTVDKRTVQRDLNKLSIPFPLCNEMEGRTNYWFWTKDAAVIDLPGMEPVAALAFEMAQEYLTPLLPTATLDVLMPYFNRAREVLNEQSSSLLSAWSNKVAVIGRGPKLLNPVISPDIQRTIYHALLNEKCIEASYIPRGEQKEKSYLIHPLALVSKMGVLYLICTLWNYTGIRQFVLHRFSQATQTEQSVNIPASFSLVTYIEKDKQFSFKVSEQTVQLKALFNAETAKHLAETPLSENQTITKHDENTVLVTAEVFDTHELRWWLQAFGDNVEVLEPINMRNKFKEVFDNLSKMYS